MKKALVVVAGLFVILLLFIASRPSSYRVERTVVIGAAPSVVFPFVADLRQFDGWSPWAKLDPTMKREYEGAPGAGQLYRWKGNEQVGSGQMTVTRVEPDARVDIQLDFQEPFESLGNTIEFLFAPSGEGSRVTWGGTFQQNFVGKAMGLFMDFETMIGADFEKGLASLKALAEAQATQPPPAPVAVDGSADAGVAAPTMAGGGAMAGPSATGDAGQPEPLIPSPPLREDGSLPSGSTSP